MPKNKNNSTPADDANARLFEQMGRMTVAAGVQFLRPRLDEFLTQELERLVGPSRIAQDAPARPARSLQSSRKTEAALEALVEAPQDKVSKNAAASKSYWAGLTPAQRKAEMKRRMDKRGQPARSRQILLEEIDGRVTVRGAAKMFGLVPAYVQELLRRAGVPSTRVKPEGSRLTVNTYDTAIVTAMAEARNHAPRAGAAQ